MRFVDINTLQSRLGQLRQGFNEAHPFRYLVVDDFLMPEQAQKLLDDFPDSKSETWNKSTYIHQKGKLQKSTFDKGSIFSAFFSEINSKQFVSFLNELTSIPDLIADPNLFGAGLHQSLNGAFLDVHVDFNVQPETKLYRRLNLLLFLNKDWKEEYGGTLELWDMEKKLCIEKIIPAFNRCVIFETNRKSYHGHPTPLNVPEGVTRKSLAVYYYTQDASADVKTLGEHNSIFVSTQGLQGRIKNLLSGLAALKERILQKFE